jgi:hypothetical protein
MPGTLGQSDLFKVNYNEDGTLETENLGNTINTEGRETFLLLMMKMKFTLHQMDILDLEDWMFLCLK